MWDTAGEERFKALTSMYYKNAHAILIGFDLSSADSFEGLEKWVKEVDEKAQIPNHVKVIVGLKSDLDD